MQRRMMSWPSREHVPIASSAKTAGRVWRALNALPFDQRAVIVLGD